MLTYGVLSYTHLLKSILASRKNSTVDTSICMYEKIRRHLISAQVSRLPQRGKQIHLRVGGDGRTKSLETQVSFGWPLSFWNAHLDRDIAVFVREDVKIERIREEAAVRLLGEDAYPHLTNKEWRMVNSRPALHASTRESKRKERIVCGECMHASVYMSTHIPFSFKWVRVWSHAQACKPILVVADSRSKK
jgi:hypothetical protein